MKRITLILSMIFVPFLSVVAQQVVVGTWTGKLDVGMTQLNLNFNIADSNGKLVGTIDSPDQGAMGIPITEVQFINNNLSLSIQALGAKYSGVLFGDAVMGTFTQMGKDFPLNLVKGTKVQAKRPQEPKAPFPYHSEDVKFYNEKAAINLVGTFTYPRGVKKCPAVVLITGSGAQDRNEEILGHKPFLVLSDYLTKQGVAVLRFDDRGVGESEGDFIKSTTRDFATDAYAAVEYLKSRSEIDIKKIGLIGHSEGGVIAIQLASEYPNDISFIVSMAGVGVSTKELTRYQSKQALLAAGVPMAAAEQNQRIAMSLIDLVEKYDDEYLRLNAPKLVANILSGDQKNDDLNKKLVDELARLSSPWFRGLLAYNPVGDLQKIKADVLALNGDKDVQMEAKPNLEAIEKNLVQARSKKMISYPNLNHLFQTSNTGSAAEYGQIEETISPIVLKDIAEWINSLK